jgi:hypothetical protein
MLLTRDSHQVSNAQTRRSRVNGLTGAELTKSGRQRSTHLEFNPGDSGDRQAEEADPDFYDPTCGAVCFHAPSVALQPLPALIDKTDPGIEQSNGPHSQLNFAQFLLPNARQPSTERKT